MYKKSQGSYKVVNVGPRGRPFDTTSVPGDCRTKGVCRLRPEHRSQDSKLFTTTLLPVRHNPGTVFESRESTWVLSSMTCDDPERRRPVKGTGDSGVFYVYPPGCGAGTGVHPIELPWKV